jgi:hypothetical protein
MFLRSGGSARSFSKKEAREIGIGLLFGIGLIGIMRIGGCGEDMGKQALLWAKDFIWGVVGESFGWLAERGGYRTVLNSVH